MSGNLQTTFQNLVNNQQEEKIVFAGQEVFTSANNQDGLFLNSAGQRIDAMDKILNRRQV
ncbi:MAG: hypothetical protein NY202_05090 [Mollicutes bacterium UO1]